jgi:hypothetical protein
VAYDCPVYPIFLIEDPDTRATVILNMHGEAVHTVPPPPDYNPYAYAQAKFPGLGRVPRRRVLALLALYDPARIQVAVDLVPAEFYANYLAADSAEAAYSFPDSGGGMQPLGGGGFAITALDRLGDDLELTFTGDDACYYVIDACSELGLAAWNPVDIVLGETGDMTWTGAADPAAARFFRVREIPISAPGDQDQDGLDDLAELALGTNPLSPDSDGDGLLDTWELANNLNPLDDGSGDPNQGADGDPDGDGIPNHGEQSLGSNPHSPDPIEDVGPYDHALSWLYKLVVVERSKEEAEAAFEQPPAPAPLLYYLRYTYDLQPVPPGCGPESPYEESHATIVYQPETCLKRKDSTDISSIPCTDPPDPNDVTRSEVIRICWGTEGTAGTRVEFCGKPSSTIISTINCTVWRPFQPSEALGWIPISEDGDEDEINRLYEYQNCTYEELETLSIPYDNALLDSVARGNLAAASPVIAEADWSRKVISDCGGVSAPQPWEPGDQPVALTDFTNREADLKMQELRYAIEFDTELDKFYRVQVLHLFDPENPNDPDEILAHPQFYFRGTGHREIFENEEMRIPPPTEEGTVLKPPSAWDHAGIWNVSPPWYDGGSFEWPIPANWRIGQAGATNSLAGWDQRFELAPNGTVTIRKWAKWVTRTTNDVIGSN